MGGLECKRASRCCGSRARGWRADGGAGMGVSKTMAGCGGAHASIPTSNEKRDRLSLNTSAHTQTRTLTHTGPLAHTRRLGVCLQPRTPQAPSAACIHKLRAAWHQPSPAPRPAAPHAPSARPAQHHLRRPAVAGGQPPASAWAPTWLGPHPLQCMLTACATRQVRACMGQGGCKVCGAACLRLALRDSWCSTRWECAQWGGKGAWCMVEAAASLRHSGLKVPPCRQGAPSSACLSSANPVVLCPSRTQAAAPSLPCTCAADYFYDYIDGLLEELGVWDTAKAAPQTGAKGEGGSSDSSAIPSARGLLRVVQASEDVRASACECMRVCVCARVCCPGK